MTEVGVRELRNSLSRWLDRVKQGEEIVVTERGRPVARLSPASAGFALDDLVARGVAIPPTGRPRDDDLPPPLPVVGRLSDVVLEQRR
jgi:prevent-host-death family protein